MPEEPSGLDGSSRRVNRLLTGLRSNIEEDVYAAAGQLQQLLCAELHTLGTAGANLLLEELWQRIADSLCAQEPADKKGLLLAISILVSVDVDAAGWRCSRAANLLRSQMPLDNDSLQLVAYAIGRTAISSRPMSISYVDFEASRAFELLTEDEQESKRQLGIHILRELALAIPNAFVKHVNQFLESVIPLLIESPNKALQDIASDAIQAVFGVICSKETEERQTFYFRFALLSALKTFDNVQTPVNFRTNAKDKLFRDDQMYGALLVLDNLLICADAAGEQLRISHEQSLHDQRVFESPSSQYQVPRQWGGNSNTQCLREYVRKSACAYTSDPLEFLLEYHKETGLRPNSLPALCTTQTASSPQCRTLIIENLERIARLVLREKESTNTHVQKMLLRLIPRLARFNQLLNGSFLQESVQHVLACCNRRWKERSSALFALGLISASVGPKISPYVDRVMSVLKVHLQSRESFARKKLPSIDAYVLLCIQLLAQAHEFKDKMNDLLDFLFSSGLSPTLADTLFVICERIPSLKKTVHNKLFLNLFQLLFRKRFVWSGSPTSSSTQLAIVQSMSSSFMSSTNSLNSNLSTFGFNLTSGNLSFSFNSNQVPSFFSSLKPIPVDEPHHAMLALRMLDRFDFPYHLIVQLFLHQLHSFLLSEPVELRLEAIRCSVRLLTPLVNEFNARSSVTLVNLIQQVLQQLLLLAMADRQPDVRYTVLSLLTKPFDVFLTQTQHLERLFVCLNDELFEIRELAVCVLGRLCEHNPAFVRPRLRNLLTELLCDLQSDAAPQFREQHIRLLAHIIQSAPAMAALYADVLLEVLSNGLRIPDPSTSYLVGSLHALGLLSRVLGVRMRIHFDRLLPPLLELVQDSSHSLRREIGLWTLGQIIDQAGCVVDPYWKYKNLLDVLLNVLRTEHSTFVRREAIKVLGLLGAVDPYEHKINIGLIDQSGTDYMADSGASLSDIQDLSSAEMLINVSSSYDAFYLAIAISNMLKIVRDPTLSAHHITAIEGINFIFNTFSMRCVPFIHQVFPVYLGLIRNSEHQIRESIFRQLCSLIPIVKDHIKEYLEQLFALIKEYWQVPGLQVSLIKLVEKISITLKIEFKQKLLPSLLPDILQLLRSDRSEDRQVSREILVLIQAFDNNSQDHLNVLLPSILKLCEGDDLPLPLRAQAFSTLLHLSRQLDLKNYFSMILQPSLRVYHNGGELRKVALELILQLTSRYECDAALKECLFIQNQIVQRDQDASYYAIDAADGAIIRKQSRSVNRTSTSKRTITKPEHSYLAAIDKSNLQWSEYIKIIFDGLLKSTPSVALKKCLTIARNYDQLPKDVFNAAFISCWNELNEDERRKTIRDLETHLRLDRMPEMINVILNLVEFMDHTDHQFPMDLYLLSDIALKHRTYAKALRFKENEFHRNPTCQALEALITVNNKLRQSPAVSGILKYATTHLEIDFKVKEQWYEKLHDWENALRCYQSKRDANPNDWDSTIGQMRCLEMMCEWDELYRISLDVWIKVDREQKAKIARMCAAAAWSLGKWDDMNTYSSHIRQNTFDSSFYQAVLSVHNNQYEMAQKLIDEARDRIDSHLTAMLGESQDRAYGAMVNVMLFSELEEVIQYKLCPDRRDLIRQKWWDRLQGCQKIVEDWQRVLRVRSLVLTSQQDKRSWLKFASICQKVGRIKLSQKTLIMLLRDECSALNDNTNPVFLSTPNKTSLGLNFFKSSRLLASLPSYCPEVTYAYLKQLWRSNERNAALEQMQSFLGDLQKKMAVAVSSNTSAMNAVNLAKGNGSEIGDENRVCSVLPAPALARLLSKCYLKLGIWHEHLHNNSKNVTIGNEECMAQVLPYYAKAAEMDPTRYKAWHSYAYCNFRAMALLKSDCQVRIKCAVSAVQSFFKSIALSHGNSLQDTLRLLTVLFDEGHQTEVGDAMRIGLQQVPIETWLQVIPQLIARVDSPRQAVCQLIQQLLIDVGRCHPQALIYPLTVAQKSVHSHRQLAANKILNNMREHSSNLVQQAALVSDELIRVSILWHELWHEGLEEASRLYFGDKNVKAMLEMLEPLHHDLDRGPTTLKEMSFKNAFGNDLAQAQKLCKKYVNSGDVKQVTLAWEFYYHVFKKISKQLPNLTSLELQFVSPKLLQCRDLELAVPGSYSPNRPIVRIARIESELQVITSKQRPRKLCIQGSNGRDYTFLLKGHEDLRQDERVMQLFGLVNSLLASDFATSRRNLAIQRYAVIPLSHNSGLIGWVPHCDTLHTLIKDHRERKKTLLNIEHRIMLRMAPNYDRLTLMQKVEIFEHALDSTQGDDIHCLLWSKSPNSEIWLERRTNYIRSLAVMSMVGYILGLGDRHPSNLMIDRLSGKVLHIDFGDCFEVAMTREKFPEKIPFRLTRMLIKAMEVTGIEGTYRITCEKVMQVLRHNKDSLMAVLEAFVYDPLLNWGLSEPAIACPSANKQLIEDPCLSTSNEDVVDFITSSTAGLELNEITGKVKAKPVVLEQSIAEPVNQKALTVVNRILDKLTGHDFDRSICLNVPNQVDLLIKQATSNENLCQLYIGWCPFW